LLFTGAWVFYRAKGDKFTETGIVVGEQIFGGARGGISPKKNGGDLPLGGFKLRTKQNDANGSSRR